MGTEMEVAKIAKPRKKEQLPRGLPIAQYRKLDRLIRRSKLEHPDNPEMWVTWDKLVLAGVCKASRRGQKHDPFLDEVKRKLDALDAKISRAMEHGGKPRKRKAS